MGGMSSVLALWFWRQFEQGIQVEIRNVTYFGEGTRNISRESQLTRDIFIDPTHYAVAQLVEVLRYKPEGRGFDSPMVSLDENLITFMYRFS
jgi:hypothetical protein